MNTIEVTGKKDTRSGFGDGILEAARDNKNVVALTADLAGSMKLGAFIKEFPERFIQCGIAEANMIGIAAGLTTVSYTHLDVYKRQFNPFPGCNLGGGFQLCSLLYF